MKIFLMIMVTIWLTACSSVSPRIQSAPAGDLQLKQAATNVGEFKGQTVRWGGKVIEVKNFETYSVIQLVQFPLNRYGRPVEDGASQGRFFSRSADFLDPEIYQLGAMVTVVGQITEDETIKVDQKTLVLPVVGIEETKVWPAFNAASGRPYNPKHDWPFVGFGYYGTGSYSP